MIQAALCINDFELSVHLGWPEEERKKKQIVSIRIEIFFSSPPQACLTDDLVDTFCYDDLLQQLKEALSHKSFRLIEHLAHDIYIQLKSCLQQDVMIHLTKKPNIPGLKQGVCFRYGDKT